MIGYHYHYWLKTLLGNLELHETIVRVPPGQTITIREQGSNSARTFASGTTLRIEDTATLFIDGLQGQKIVCMEVPWGAISSMGFSYEAPLPR
jgi:hypothetical protein